LRAGAERTAGSLIALAASIKAFPLLALGYLLYRKHWRATVSTVLCLIFFLVVFPAPWRGLGRNLEDLRTWTTGMLRYDSESISQREQRGFSWSSHSLIAVAHRLLRPVNAHRSRNELLSVNIADLSFEHVNLVIVVISFTLCRFYVYCMPGYTQRTNSSDALEQTMLLLLILMFTPLAFNYFFVWLLYPMVVPVHLVLSSRRLLGG
jgi:hypothetical protein